MFSSPPFAPLITRCRTNAHAAPIPAPINTIGRIKAVTGPKAINTPLRGPLATSALARGLGITVVGIRQHLAKLRAEGLVAFEDQAGEIGRPRRFWRLTAKGHGRFPDTHGDLTVNLIGGIRSVFGEAGLDRLIEARQKSAVAAYRRALGPCSGLEDRIRTVARLRTEEGYMAEFEAEPDGSFLLIENHCPICAAAK